MSELSFDGRPNHTPVGYFTYTVRDDYWSWSDGLFEVHGYAPQAVAATTELILRHKHPDDALRAYEVLEAVVANGQPFSCYHRIVDAKTRVRYVLSVGRGVLDAYGRVEQVTGFFVDLTEVRADELRDAAARAEGDAALVRLAERRSQVDQAKGIVMVATGCDEHDAFGALRRCAAARGIRLHELASRMVERAGAHHLPEGNPCRVAVEELLADLDG